MSTQQIKRITIGSVVLTLFLFSAVDATFAAGRDVQVSTTGDGQSSEADCKKREAGINSWADEEVAAMERGDEKGAKKAKRNYEGLLKDATDNGCFVIY
jgi:hypothetical protein